MVHNRRAAVHGVHRHDRGIRRALQPLPNTAAFHAIESAYVVVGISLVTVLGAHTYQLVTLEATRMRLSSFRRQW